LEASVTAEEKTSNSPMKWGIVLFLMSEAFLFGSLFATYYYLRAETAVWPPVGVQIDSALGVINTVILLSSSGVMWWAGKSIQNNNQKGLTKGLAAVIVLGVIFLGITIFEWTHESFRPWTSAYGSIFYTLTGFHALHVLGGVALMAALLRRNLKHQFSASRFMAVEIGSLYWHFVDLIWIFVFTTLFIVR
jgi:heme/copper-type cytochrome/quinol oxidase subunit 3